MGSTDAKLDFAEAMRRARMDPAHRQEHFLEHLSQQSEARRKTSRSPNRKAKKAKKDDKKDTKVDKGKGKGKKGIPAGKRLPKGVTLHSKKGKKPICFRYNQGTCSKGEGCGMLHACQVCLESHALTKCPKLESKGQ